MKWEPPEDAPHFTEGRRSQDGEGKGA